MASKRAPNLSEEHVNGGESLRAEDLRFWVLQELKETGFTYGDERIAVDEDLSKEQIRNLHARQRAELLIREHNFVRSWQAELIGFFADGLEVDPYAIDPKLVPVQSEGEAALFRFASLHWSVPVSRGYGRRTRFLLFDRQNERLIGIFALGDPVYNLNARDRLIGWNASQRNERLYNVLDAFVLGALPPYRQLLGGKLVAMAAVSDEAREVIARKYKGQKTEILGTVKQSRPVLITTTSSLGRSSIYNRVRFNDRALFQAVGYTRGFGHFQFSEPLFSALLDFMKERGLAPGYKYGNGPNWRIRTLRSALRLLDLHPDLLQHGIKRQVFVAPLAARWKEYLRGEATYPRWYSQSLDDLATFFRHRWAVPRSERDASYLGVVRESMVLDLREGEELVEA